MEQGKFSVILPLVYWYISEISFVERLCKGRPLRPPTSLPSALVIPGLSIVVFEITKPSI